jgi:hypothetical protein
MGIDLDALPDPARAAWQSLRDEVRTILGDDLVAMWAHGGSTSIGDPPHAADLDTHVVVAHRPDEAIVGRLEEAEAATGRQHRVEWDNWYVLADDARGSDPPQHAWRDGRRDTAWGILRAHLLAGRYVLLDGAEPATIVTPPRWEELESELSRELEHIERHVLEGDTDPFEATYALLNGSRILRAIETHDVAISKRAAGTWGLRHLPDRWQPALEAAVRNYDGHPNADDADRLAAEMAPFVGFVRERLPDVADRPADEPPRWSGY